MTNAALIEKLEKAKEGSRAMSDEVLVKFGWTTHLGWNDETNWVSPDGSEHGDNADSRPDPTRNLQDIRDEVKRRGYQYAIQTFDESEALNPGGAQASINKAGMSEYQSAEAKTDCNALSIALLKALEAGE